MLPADVESELASELILGSAKSTLNFAVGVMKRVFDEECRWINAGDSRQLELFETRPTYLSSQLYTVVLIYVVEKIGRAEERSTHGEYFGEALPDLPILDADLSTVTEEEAEAVKDLIWHIGYDLFGVKRSLMTGFQRKVRRLQNAISDLDETSSQY